MNKKTNLGKKIKLEKKNLEKKIILININNKWIGPVLYSTFVASKIARWVTSKILGDIKKIIKIYLMVKTYNRNSL